MHAEISQALGISGGNPQDVDRELRARLDQYHLEIFHRTQAETTKRWTYEQEIKRPYFHVTELDDGQLANWSKYLDFEEGEGDFKRTSFLYERCLVTAAHYDEFWQRYVRWMYAHVGKNEEVRNIFQRASCLYTPIARPAIRLQWALFEESCDRPSVASAIYEAILLVMPDHVEAIMCLANLQRRQEGHQSAVAVYQQYLNSPECSSQTKGTLVSEMARLTYQMTGSADESRTIFETHKQSLLDSEPFWNGHLAFELDQPVTASTEAAQNQRVRAVHDDLRKKNRLAPDAVKNLSQQYMRFLARRGGRNAAIEYMALDTEVNGPASAASLIRIKNAGAEKTAARIPTTNGHGAAA